MNRERLLQAIKAGNISEVKGLLRAPDVQTMKDFEDPEYDYPLSVALDQCGTNSTSPMLRFLVENRFHLNDQTSGGYRAVVCAARLRNIAALELMVQNGAQLSWPVTGPLIFCSAVQGLFPRNRNHHHLNPNLDPNFEETLRWLVQKGCSLNNLGNGILHNAVEIGDYGVIPLLCELGADLNEMAFIHSKRGTPLHGYNGPYGNDDGYNAVKLLLELGANPRIRNDEGLDVRAYYESLLIRASGKTAGIDEIQRVIQLVDRCSSPKDAGVQVGHIPTQKDKTPFKRERNGLGSLVFVVAVLVAMIGYGATRQANQTDLENRTGTISRVSATVIRTANVRDRPTTLNSSVLSALQPGTALNGEWVQGTEDNVRWLYVELSDGRKGYVWEGNLTVD
jgi:ankyrin repeat protein